MVDNLCVSLDGFVTVTDEKLVDPEQESPTWCGTRVGTDEPLQPSLCGVFADRLLVLSSSFVVRNRLAFVCKA